MNITYQSSFVIKITLIFTLIFKVNLLSFSASVTTITQFINISTPQIIFINTIFSAFKASIKNVIYLIKNPDLIISKGINNMIIKIKKLICTGKAKQRSFQFSKKLVIDCKMAQLPLFEITFKNNKLSVKQVLEELNTYDEYVTTYATGNLNKDELRLTIPKTFIERHKLGSAVEFIQIIENNLIRLVYEVPKKIADPIKAAIKAHKAAIRRLEKLSVAK